jgi:hypothetical protein
MEQITASVCLFAERGLLCVIEMLDTADFFEQQAKECRTSAARSRNKNDREFWLEMAVRWEGFLKTRQSGDDEPVLRATRFRRSMLLARQAAKRRHAA